MKKPYRVEWLYTDGTVENYEFRSERQARIFMAITVRLERLIRRLVR